MKDNIYSLKIIDNLIAEKMIGYQEIWDKLYLKNDELTPFRSFQWNLRLIKNFIYKGNIKLAIFYKNNEPIIIFPYMIVRKFLIFRVIKFLGTDTIADYLNFIYNKEISITDFQSFWEMISKNYKKLIFNLNQINEMSKISNFMSYISKYYIKIKSECYQIPIYNYNNGEDYFNSLGKRTKRRVKECNRAVSEKFDNKLKFNIKINNLMDTNCIKTCLKLYYNRLKIKTGKIDIDVNYNSFLEDIFKGAYKKDKIFLACCCADKCRPYAINLGFYSPNCKKIYICINAMDSDFKDYYVGSLLLYNSIFYVINNKNLNISFYDLTRGDEIYKKRFGGKLHNNYTFIVSKYYIFTLIYDFLHNFRMKLSKYKKFIRIFYKVKNN